jgi:hypothetical protein
LPDGSPNSLASRRSGVRRASGRCFSLERGSIFRTRADAELTGKIYEKIPMLVNEATGENSWGISAN